MRNGPFGSASAHFFCAALLAATALATKLSGPAAKPQQPPQQGDVQSSILVSFNFNVRDNHDHPVENLSASQIHISLDGKAQTIESLTPVRPQPISIVFLVQQSNSRRARPRGTVFYPELQPALHCFRRLLALGASVQVAEFDNEPNAEGGFSTAASDLFDSMQKLARSGPGGASALFDSLAWASKRVAERAGYYLSRHKTERSRLGSATRHKSYVAPKACPEIPGRSQRHVSGGETRRSQLRATQRCSRAHSADEGMW